MMQFDRPLDDIIFEEKNRKRGRSERATQLRRKCGFPGSHRESPHRWLRKQDSFRPDPSKKILISNVSFRIDDTDIYRLFSEIGNINKSFVNYDKSGRSRGTAEVIYYRREDAAAAFRRYQNFLLDDRPIKIKYVSTGSNTVRRDTYTKPISGDRFTSGGNGNKDRFNKSYVRKAKSCSPERTSPDKVVTTKKTLDAQMEHICVLLMATTWD